jgi:hypothetical protein
MNQPDEPAMRWLSVAEAAPLLGLTVDGLRSRIKRGLAKTRKGNDGRLVVNVAVDSADPGHDPVHEPAVDSPPDPEPPPDLLPELLEARDRAARAESALAEVRAVLSREQARADRLEAALAEARKPALVRLLEALRRR